MMNQTDIDKQKQIMALVDHLRDAVLTGNISSIVAVMIDQDGAVSTALGVSPANSMLMLGGVTHLSQTLHRLVENAQTEVP